MQPVQSLLKEVPLLLRYKALYLQSLIQHTVGRSSYDDIVHHLHRGVAPVLDTIHYLLRTEVARRDTHEVTILVVVHGIHQFCNVIRIGPECLRTH